MENQKTKEEILQKRDTLLSLQAQLNKEFIGLEKVIEEVINLLMPWYLFPEAQLRPTVINMWGLTGSGKTALVGRIIELLNYQRLFVQMDMGEFESDSASWIKSMFTDDLEFFHEQAGVICFDEFQFARTIKKDGEEMGKDKLRVIWEMLDSGKISYIPYQNSYYLMRADLCLMLLSKCIDKGIVMANGVVVEQEAVFMESFEAFYFEEKERFGKAVDASYFLSQDFIEGLLYLYQDDTLTKPMLTARVEKSDALELRRIILEGMSRRSAVKQLDLSKSLIFVLGNLDEAYYMSNSLNPDIHADELYEATKKINLGHIKEALKKRFRNEQIARLGNNHIIYTSFTQQNFKDIIVQKLNELKAFVLDRFQLEIVFDKSVVEIVYAEGVYPAQGTRPVFTTIKNIIEGHISKLLLKMMEKDLQAKYVNWSYEEESFIFSFKDQFSQTLFQYREPLVLKMSNLRKTENIHHQAHTAVHEAGHAIVAALALRIIPSLVVSKTAAADSEGFCMVNMPEGPITYELLKKEMMIGLGGYVAEKLIFGEENTCSGVSSDIERVSEMANRAVKEYAMGADPIFIRLAATQDDLAMVHQQTHTQEAIQLIKECEVLAFEILLRNKLLLLKMSSFLTYQSRMEEPQILEMVCDYAQEEWVERDAFIKKHDYFRFADVVEKELATLLQSNHLLRVV